MTILHTGTGTWVRSSNENAGSSKVISVDREVV